MSSTTLLTHSIRDNDVIANRLEPKSGSTYCHLKTKKVSSTIKMPKGFINIFNCHCQSRYRDDWSILCF